MRKRPVAHLALAFLLGVYLCPEGRAGIFLGAGILVFDLLLLASLPGKQIRIALLCGAIVLSYLCGIWRTDCCLSRDQSVQSYLDQGEEYIFEGKLYKKEVKNDTFLYYLKESRTQSQKLGKIILYMDEDTLPIGSYLLAKGKRLDFHMVQNEGGFDEKKYYLSMSICSKFVDVQILKEDTPIWSMDEALFRLRRRMLAFYQKSLPGEEAGLLAMMVMGDKSEADPEAKEIFSKAGLSHIFAISGMHISLVGLGLYGLLRRRKVSIIKSAFFGVIFVFAYTRMAGAPVSAIRACGMFFFMMWAYAGGLTYDTLSGLSLMATILAARDPLIIREASFVLSFGAVIGLVVVANPAAAVFESLCRMRWEQTHKRGKGRRYKVRFHHRIVAAVLWGCGMQIATLPLVAYFYYAVPLYVIVLNLILLPFMGVLLVLGLLGGLLGVSVLLTPCHYLIYFYEMFADASTKWPGASWIIGRPFLWQIILYYVLLAGSMCALDLWIRRREEEHEKAIERVSGRIHHQRQVFGVRILVLRTSLVCIGLLFLIRFRPPASFEVVMLSVGQGDGIFIESGMGERYMIDGGSTSEKELGRYTLLPFLKSRGISCIDTWFLTHMDEDHISGFIEVLESGYRIRSLVLAKSVEQTGRYEEILQLCKERDVQVRYMSPGDILRCDGGVFHKRALVLQCLAPEWPSVFSGANENSLVLGLQYYWEENGRGFDAVFTGDMGTEQEERLVASGSLKGFASDGIVEILKSAHHGSNNSNCSEWLSALSPEVCIISAGKNNRYHHPGKEAIARMDEQGIPHLCTIDCGQITVRSRGGRYVVERYLE